MSGGTDPCEGEPLAPQTVKVAAAGFKARLNGLGDFPAGLTKPPGWAPKSEALPFEQVRSPAKPWSDVTGSAAVLGAVSEDRKWGAFGAPFVPGGHGKAQGSTKEGSELTPIAGARPMKPHKPGRGPHRHFDSKATNQKQEYTSNKTLF
ncbi:hypothetical protein SKAU_G00349160 [Synaphobranchus kaupii]|uniref:Uncharacterized protein n=1 Tax=Synaphobranchus kaupii TaxID=118154 RepID=A0A9Q1EK55_SYNKA|nr:hypothetical protein SKAU_G00349160 [Synaphobranchus kaupii]